jgi:beta-lactam-binding protein with PASTA domain
MSGWAIAGITMGGIFVFLIALGALVGGDASGTDDKAGTTTVSPTTAKDDSKPAKRADATPSSQPFEDKTATLPEMVGKGLQSAQDQAQAAGFNSLTSHDALGRDRMQALDRNWKVCSQTPKPGSYSTKTKVDFGAVKLDEDCPDKDVAEQPKAGASMPNFVGKSMKTARGALDSSTSITVVDASGQDRMVLVESNWQVCSQNPRAGEKLDGQPVSFKVVKFEESC